MSDELMVKLMIAAVLLVVGGGGIALLVGFNRREKGRLDELARRTELNRTSLPNEIGADEVTREVLEGTYQGWPVRLSYVHSSRIGKTPQLKVYQVYEIDCFPGIPEGVLIARSSQLILTAAPESVEVEGIGGAFGTRFQVLALPGESDSVRAWLKDDGVREAVTELFDAFGDGDSVIEGSQFRSTVLLDPWGTKVDEVIGLLDAAAAVGERLS